VRGIKIFLIGGIIGILAGLWFGMNIGKEQPLLANPFARPSLGDRIADTGNTLVDRGGHALKKAMQ